MLFAALEILFRQRWRYLALFVLLPLVAGVACTRIYSRASAAESIWIGNQTYLNTQRPYYQQFLTPSQLTLTDMTQYFQTGEFADRVTLLLQKQHAFLTPGEAAATRGSLGAGLVATAVGPNLLSLSYTGSRTTLCMAVLSAALQVFEQHEGATLTSQQAVATQVYSRQLTDANKALSEAQHAVAAYLAAHPNETPGQQANDSQLSVLNQSVTDEKAAATSAQTKLNTVAASSLAAQVANNSLYQVIDRPHRTSGRLSSLPRKQMLMAAGACWALGLLLLAGTLRYRRPILHPAQLERALGFAPVAVTAPLHAPDPGGSAGRLLGAGGSR